MKESSVNIEVTTINIVSVTVRRFRESEITCFILINYKCCLERCLTFVHTYNICSDCFSNFRDLSNYLLINCDVSTVNVTQLFAFADITQEHRDRIVNAICQSWMLLVK